jgi:hypothetical protein
MRSPASSSRAVTDSKSASRACHSRSDLAVARSSLDRKGEFAGARGALAPSMNTPWPSGVK